MKSSSTEYLTPGLNGASVTATCSADDDAGTTTVPEMAPLIVLSGGRDGANQNVLAFYSLADAQKAFAGGVQFLLSDPNCKRVCVQIELLNPGGIGGQKPPAANGELSEADVGALVSELIGGDDDDGGELRPSSYNEAEPRAAGAKAAPPPAKTSPHKPPPPKPKKKGVEDDEEVIRVPVKYWVVLGVLGFLAVGYYGSEFLSRLPSADVLASRTLSGSTKEVRLSAAQELLRMPPETVLADVRRLATETNDPEVLVLFIDRLRGMSDAPSIPTFFTAMKHENKEVREAGLRGATRYYGETLPVGVTYHVDDPKDERDRAVAKLLDNYTNPPVHTMPKSR